MSSAAHAAWEPLSVAEVQDLQDHDPLNRYELIEGELYVTPPQGFDHSQSAGEIAARVRDHIRAHTGGIALLDVIIDISEKERVVPDVSVVLPDRRHIVPDGGPLKGAPHIAVEVLSPSTQRRDRTVKRDLYARSGVREHWVVDYREREVTQHRFEAGEVRVLGVGDVVVTPLLPGFELPVADIFRDPWTPTGRD